MRAIALAFDNRIPQKAYPPLATLCGICGRLGTLHEIIDAVEKMIVDGENDYPLALSRMYAIRGDYHLQRYDFDAAFADYERGAPWTEKFEPMSAVKPLEMMIYCCLRLGRLDTAETLLPRAEWHAGASLDPLANHSFERAKGLVSFYQGDYDSVREILESSLSAVFPDLMKPPDQALTTVALYCAEAKRLTDQLAYEDAQRIIQMLDSLGSDWPLGLEVAVLGDLYRTFVARGWFPKRFEAAFAAKPAQLKLRPLEIRTLGGFSVSFDGKAVALSRKRREVLVCLALNGQTTADELMLAVWPDAPEARKTLNNTVRAIRACFTAAVGWRCDDIIVYDDASGVYRIGPGLDVRLDAHAFTRIDTTDHARRSLKAYHGDFLTPLMCEWVVEKRSYFQSVAVSLCHQVAANPMSSAEEETYLKRALEIDPDSLETYERLIDFYRREDNGMMRLHAELVRDRLLKGLDTA